MSHVVCEPVPEVSKYVRQSVDRHVYFTFDKQPNINEVA